MSHFELYKKSDRYRYARSCPCGKSNKDGKFVPLLIDGTPSSQYGYCHSCGKSFWPSEYKNCKTGKSFKKVSQSNGTIKSVPKEKLVKTIRNTNQNNFIAWLKRSFREKDVKNAIYKFGIGTGKYDNTLFWYIDIYGNIRTAKSVFYGSDGHRDKNKPIFSIYTKSKGYYSCIYGEHQLRNVDYNIPIILEESEKDAIIGYLSTQKYIWLATGGANNVGWSKLQVLKNRKIILNPHADESGRKGFEKLAKYFNKLNCQVEILDFGSNFQDGTDISDLLIKS